MSLKILIVDDALFMRNLLRGVLEGAGHQVVGEAGDGAAAVARYRSLRPDLVMMDIVMPDKTGIEALREIMAEDPGARVVMCSALGQDALVMEAVQGGARDFIVKPFKDEQVLEVVARVAGEG
ncbi:response regulator [Geoalkalibacter halelectricus]|uniref:Response regulator n=1 Tax=Geoalkalibacter halelectricus TaxID=2847045 RepID=A0ABY5ZNI4_9BACT|nr:response regulator [Geoalkalibacter halelectricus]MDO3378389.1 response regulator [Geoalkalibacter halelectricus]UWZ80291.1 response regulator [Geoalkalibacter halelectricus]